MQQITGGDTASVVCSPIISGWWCCQQLTPVPQITHTMCLSVFLCLCVPPCCSVHTQVFAQAVPVPAWWTVCGLEPVQTPLQEACA